MTEPAGKRTTTTRQEWRVCGEHPTNGAWEGAWHSQSPVDYEVRELAKRSRNVRIETRHVLETEPEVVDRVPSALDGQR